jgi:hypothetical protein
MFDRCSFESHGPPVEQSREAKLVLACSLLHVAQCELSFREDLQLVCHQYAPGRYGYVRFYDNGELELFLPRDHKKNPRRVPC